MEKKEQAVFTGVCKFCGQIITLGQVLALRKREEQNPDYWASRTCACAEAKAYNRDEIHRENEIRERKARKMAAVEVIEKKLGPAAAQIMDGRAFPELDVQVRSVCAAASELLVDGIITDMSLGAIDGSKIKLTVDDKTGNVEVRRKQSLEI